MAKKPKQPTVSGAAQKTRLWLSYPPKLIQEPLLWKLAKSFEVITNIRQASISDQLGIVCLELEGQRAEINSAIKWMEKQGVKVEPVEINVIES
jgi:ABC-type methionine transport system ATPase subunit